MILIGRGLDLRRPVREDCLEAQVSSCAVLKVRKGKGREAESPGGRNRSGGRDAEAEKGKAEGKSGSGRPKRGSGSRESGSGEPRRKKQHTISGDNSLRDPPVPIPNTEVKPQHADGTWLETARESRSSPDSNSMIVEIDSPLSHALVAQWQSIRLLTEGL